MSQWQLCNLSEKQFFINKISIFWRFVSLATAVEASG
jgi:hypothetical protein